MAIICYIMCFDKNFLLEVLSKIADFYNTSVDYLLFRTDTPVPYPRNQTNKNKDITLL